MAVPGNPTMGNLSAADKTAIRRGAWCNSPGIPEHLQCHYQIQVRHKQGAWINRYGNLNEAQADIYWRGQCAHNGWQARLLHRGREIDRKLSD